MSGLEPFLLAGLGGVAAATMMKQPQAPTPQAPTTMPTPDDKAVKAARAKKLAELARQGGRVGTYLSDTPAGDKLGG